MEVRLQGSRATGEVKKDDTLATEAFHHLGHLGCLGRRDESTNSGSLGNAQADDVRSHFRGVERLDDHDVQYVELNEVLANVGVESHYTDTRGDLHGQGVDNRGRYVHADAWTTRGLVDSLGHQRPCDEWIGPTEPVWRVA